MITDEQLLEIESLAADILDGGPQTRAKAEAAIVPVAAHCIVHLINRLRESEEALRICRDLNDALRDREAAMNTKGNTDE